MLNNSAPRAAVGGTFCDSGGTIIAARPTGWICYAMDIDARCVDVAVQRWQALTDHAAALGARIGCSTTRPGTTARQRTALMARKEFLAVVEQSCISHQVSFVWFGLLSLLVIERRARCPPPSDD
jgi:hypothetical protein